MTEASQIAELGLPRSAFLHIFDESVVVDDPIGVHTDESRAVMLQRLGALYSLKCHRGCFIHSIVSIIDMQAAEIGYESDLGQGQVRVQFSAYTLKYVEGDIVAGAEVVSKDSNIIHATISIGGVTRLFINIRTGRNTESIAVRQNIVVRLRRIAYPYGNDKIVANGELYMPVPIVRVYDCGLSDYTVTTEAESMIARLADLHKALRDVPDWRRYHDALLAWKGTPTANAKTANLIKLAGEDGKLPRYIARDPRYTGDSAVVVVYNEPVFPGDYELMYGVSPECVVIDILREEIAYLQLMLDCSDVYAGSAFAAHNNMWTVIASGKV